MAQRTRSKRRSGINALAYLGVEPVSPINFEIHSRTPTTRDIRGRFIGDMWLHATGLTDPTNDDIYMIVSKAGGVARWLSFGAGNLERLQGNTGGYVEPDANENINVVGNVTHGLTIAGNPGTSTLTLGTVNNENILQSLTGDVGAAVFPDGTNNITVTGTSGIVVTGNPGTNTLTLSMGSAATSYVTDTNTAVPAAHSLNIFGTAPVRTDAPVPGGSSVNVSLSNGANGQVLIGGGLGPAWASITSTSLTITPGPNTLDFSYVPALSTAGFCAYLTATTPAVTGDGTEYPLICNQELFDINGDYTHTTGVFRAPYNGYYNFYTNITFLANATGGYEAVGLLVTPTTRYIGSTFPTFRKLANFDGNIGVTYICSISIQMSVGDTIWAAIQSNLGSLLDRVYGAAAPNIYTYFCGYLLYRT